MSDSSCARPLVSERANRLPEYAVLLPVYYKDEASQFFRAALSMLNQSIMPSQLVIVCDGPLTDELEEALTRIEDKAALEGVEATLVKLDKSKGLGNALNIGLKYCKQDFVARMDSDDISRPKRCEQELLALTDKSLDLVGGCIEEFDAVPGDLGRIRNVPITLEEIIEYSKRRNPFNHMTVMFNKNSVVQAGGYQHCPGHEDYWLWVRMISNGSKCENLPDVLVDVCVGGGMLDRRGGFRYLCSQISFFSQLRQDKYLSSFEWVKAIFPRIVASMVPRVLREKLYKTFLRSRRA